MQSISKQSSSNENSRNFSICDFKNIVLLNSKEEINKYPNQNPIYIKNELNNNQIQNEEKICFLNSSKVKKKSFGILKQSTN
jgi:hypothetical protein